MIVKIGDVVRLKSGGPWMTVDDVKTDSRDGVSLVHTLWINAKGEVKWGNFPADGVVKTRDTDLATVR
jgi:uncharacterized protein YodC (DUF2158 family)